MLKPAALFFLTIFSVFLFSFLGFSRFTEAAVKCPPIIPGTEQKDNVGLDDLDSSAGAPPYREQGKNVMKNKAADIISKADFCSDESVTLKNNYFLGQQTSTDIILGTTRQCKTEEDKKKYGCDPGQIQPTVCLALGEDDDVLVVSKCDKQALINAVSRTIDTEDASSLEELARQLQANPRVPEPDLGTFSARENEIFRGLSPILGNQRAENLIEDNRGNRTNTDLLEELSGILEDENSYERNKDRANEIATRLGFSLNPDTVNKVYRDRSTGAQKPDESGGVISAGGGVTREYTNPNTFPPSSTSRVVTTEGMAQASCAIATKESGSCAGNYRAINRSIPDAAWGKYQVRGNNLISWTGKYCSHAMGGYEFLADSTCQEQVFQGEFGSYVRVCGYEGAALKWFTGSCTPSLSRSDGLTTAGRYLSDFRKNFSGSVLPFSSYTSIYNGGGSPFAKLSPFGTRNYTYNNRTSPEYALGGAIGQVVSRFTGGGGGGNIFGTIASWFKGSDSGSESGIVSGSESESMSLNQTVSVDSLGGSAAFGTPSSGNLTPKDTLLNALQNPSSVSPSSSVQADAAILVQPREITRGQSLTVSWSSVGMRASPACRVLLTADISTALVAERNEGSQILPTTASAEAGTWTFTLECIRLSDSQRVERTDSVKVQ